MSSKITHKEFMDGYWPVYDSVKFDSSRHVLVEDMDDLAALFETGSEIVIDTSKFTGLKKFLKHRLCPYRIVIVKNDGMPAKSRETGQYMETTDKDLNSYKRYIIHLFNMKAIYLIK